MRSFLYAFFRRQIFHKTPPKPRASTTVKAMSGGSAAALLYAATFSGPSSLGAVPKDEKDKTHHLKDGKGFRNPWPSWGKEPSGPAIAATLIW